MESSIRFDNVSFAYQKDRQILNHVCLTIHPGEKVAVVGPSGSGKSTLAKLLFRFYDVTAGGIYVDDQNISLCTQDSLREQISMVPQDATLFNESIRFNIQYGNTQATEQQLLQALSLVNLDGLISDLPEGLNTIVGERGLKLSGGEVQRIAIARAILKQPKIMVFDEATSSLDSNTEAAVMQSIQQVTKGVTSLVIAHRLSTIVDADRIYVLNNGGIVEQGTHAELLAANQLYSELWKIQQHQNSYG